MVISLFQRWYFESDAKSAAKQTSGKRIYLKWLLKRSPLMNSILYRLSFGMARLVAVTIKKNGRIVKGRLFAAYFGIKFKYSPASACSCFRY